MREILFRGRAILSTSTNDLDKFVYGSLVRDKEEGFSNIISRKNVWFVDRETVGQFTGFKDNNGKRIFEGDTIWWHNAPGMCDGNGVVVWDECCGEWRIESDPEHPCLDDDGEDYEVDNPLYDVIGFCEVTGTIHDEAPL